MIFSFLIKFFISRRNDNIVNQISIPNAEIGKNIPGLFEETARQNDIMEVFDSKFEWEYKMDHKKRGKTLIFNHYEFNHSLNLGKRKATDEDCKNLLATFASLNFEVETYRDSTFYEIHETLKKGRPFLDIRIIYSTDLSIYSC